MSRRCVQRDGDGHGGALTWSADDFDSPTERTYPFPHPDNPYRFLLGRQRFGIKPDTVIRYVKGDSLSGLSQCHGDVLRLRVFRDIAQALLQQAKEHRHDRGRNAHRGVPLDQIHLEAGFSAEFADQPANRIGQGRIAEIARDELMRE